MRATTGEYSQNSEQRFTFSISVGLVLLSQAIDPKADPQAREQKYKEEDEAVDTEPPEYEQMEVSGPLSS